MSYDTTNVKGIRGNSFYIIWLQKIIFVVERFGKDSGIYTIKNDVKVAFDVSPLCQGK
jgi:hypothetical protein